jgi:hypothetical protein
MGLVTGITIEIIMGKAIRMAFGMATRIAIRKAIDPGRATR